MQNEKLKTIYEDNDLLVVDKPAGIVVFAEKEEKNQEKTLIDYLLDKFPNLNDAGKAPRYGIVHRLDKDTSGILLVAKNNRALNFFQEQFKKRLVQKKYLTLVSGNIKQDEGVIETLIGRSPKDRRKQKALLFLGVESNNTRGAITEYKVIKRFKKFTFLETIPKTGRKHQIRAHFAYLQHPIAGDKLYKFKNQECPEGLTRQFLHASYLRITLPNGKTKEFRSELPQELKKIIEKLKPTE